MTSAGTAPQREEDGGTPPAAPSSGHSCRFCGTALRDTFVDLGTSPLCESYLTADELDRPESFYPLHVQVCAACWLVQLPAYVGREEIFREYAYFSSYSDSWLTHAEAYVDLAIDRFGLDANSLVVELASNDGYLLQYFVRRGVPVLGIEPAANIAPAAEQRGVPTLVEFFDDRLAEELVGRGRTADLVVANNVLAQVPDLNSFVRGIKALLAPGGVLTIEVPHLQRLVEGNQFDTVYHEHFSYFSFLALVCILEEHGFEVFDVDELWTHGGSLRVYAQHLEHRAHPVSHSVGALLHRERADGYEDIETYQRFEVRVEATKRRLLEFLIAAKDRGRTVVGYGAPGKGNTLLNYCGIRQDFLDYTVDRNPYKQGKFLPGTHIPIHPPDHIKETEPDYVLILPWNFKDEIMQQLAGISVWGGRFVVPIPSLHVYD